MSIAARSTAVPILAEGLERRCLLSAFWFNPLAGTFLWNDSTNWSATQNGPGGAGVPANGDDAHFSPTADQSITFDTNYTGGGLALKSVHQGRK